MSCIIKERNINLDIIRCIAVVLVLGVHFLLHSGFYSVPVVGGSMFVMMAARTICMMCVPLFLVLTGYLMNKKELSLQYYKGIVYVVVIYLVYAVFYLLFNVVFLRSEAGLLNTLLNIIKMDKCGYAWYVEMYIGLFLIIPFLNLIYSGLKNKNEKIWLVVSFSVLTVLPSILNLIEFQSVNRVLNAMTFWESLYPITYYFIGAYISEFKPKMPAGKNLFYYLLVVLACSILNFFKYYGGFFQWTSLTAWGGFENTVTTVLLFIFIVNLKTDKVPVIVKNGVSLIAKLSFGIYLMSYFSDMCVYAMFTKLLPDISSRFMCYGLCVLISFILAFLLSLVADWIYRTLFFVFKKTRIKSLRKHV